MKIEVSYRMLGLRLQMEREHRKITQDEIAKKTGLNRTSISNIEMGRQRIQLHDFLKFCKALNMTPQKLIKGISD